MTAKLNRRLHDARGFTLIEIIVTIIISAVLAVILAQVMGGQPWRSYWPLQTFNETLALKAVMEDIASDYRHLLSTDPSPLQTLQTRVAAGRYWSGKSYAGSIQQNSYCLDHLNEDGSADPGESIQHPNCTIGHAILKMSISYGGHSLTTLFTR